MKFGRIGVGLVICGVGLTSAAGGQSMMMLGARGGYNRSDASVTVSGSSVSTTQRNGFHVGGVLGMALSPKFSIQIEGYLSKRGFDIDSALTELPSGLDLSYVDLPLLGVFTYPIGSGFLSPRALAGPVLGLKVSCHVSGDFIDETGNTECDPQRARSIDFGVIGGLGIKVGRGYGGLTLDAFLNYGLVDIDQSDEPNVIKNRTFLLSLGFLIPVL